jgi:Tfp pilus assembly protein PilO
MSTTRSLTFGVLGVLAATVAATWLVIVPNYKDVASLRQQIREMNVKIAGLDSNRKTVAKLEEEVKQASERSQTQLKVIPEAPDVADLIRKLSLPVDGVNVVDQTFTAGTANDVDLGTAGTVRTMPLTVDMDATFDSIFALMRAAESMNRLLRVSSLKVAVKPEGRDSKDEAAADVPVLEASLGIEAVYAPAIGDADEEVR